LSNQFYDVIVVGAGPAGSYASCQLASSGYRVAVLEQKSAPGLDVCCTGIISTECFDSFDINPEVISNRANSAKFFSPSGKCLRLQTEKIQACIVDRPSFDQAIARKAQTEGASYFFSSRVITVTVKRDRVQIEALCHKSKEIFAARAAILADGFKSGLSQHLALGKINHFLTGAQVEMEARGIDEVEIYFGQQIAPGSFAWLVPISPDKVLAGLLATSQAKLHLQKFLLSLSPQNRIISQNTEIKQKAIPLQTLPRTYGDRILVIGDAAGQVKPSTAGGIYFGHIGAAIAAEVLSESLSSDDLTTGKLSGYQKAWKAKIGKEISLDYRARCVYSKLGDHQIERVFNILDSDGITETLLNSPSFSFDWHSKLLMTALKYRLAHPWRKARHILPWEANL